MSDLELFQIRQALLELFLRDRGYDGLLITRPDNFAMATGGRRNYIWTYSDVGANSLFVTGTGQSYYVGNRIEQGRILDEELQEFGCGSIAFNWWDGHAAEVVKQEFTGNLVSDDGSLGRNVHDELAVLRSLLSPMELEKYRVLGRRAAESMTACLAQIEAGTGESDIAAMLVAEGQRRHCQVPVALIAADDRIAKYRHPLPTVNSLLPGGETQRGVEQYVMVVGCFLCEGLVVSMTRFKQVAALSADIEGSFARICGVDALMQEATTPGRTLGEVFEACQKAYVDLDFEAQEWHNHHQGGATGYAGRTKKGTPGEQFPVLAEGWSARVKELSGISTTFGAAFAWNPSAPGVKSEDTFLLLPDGSQEIVSATPSLPQIDLEAVLGRPTAVKKSGIAV
jgi:Xaa-Pro dipeptidase